MKNIFIASALRMPTGEASNPLPWSLQLYKTCTMHSLPPRERCPHCAKEQAFLPSFPDLSRCYHCDGSLAHVGSIPSLR